MSIADPILAEDVDSPETFCAYVEQISGTPWTDAKNMAILRKKLKEFFAHNPDLDYRALVRTAQWAVSRKRRFAHTWQVVAQFRYAWQAGALGDLRDANDSCRDRDLELEKDIERALSGESRDVWRYRLMSAQGVRARRTVYQEWLEDTNGRSYSTHSAGPS